MFFLSSRQGCCPAKGRKCSPSFMSLVEKEWGNPLQILEWAILTLSSCCHFSTRDWAFLNHFITFSCGQWKDTHIPLCAVHWVPPSSSSVFAVLKKKLLSRSLIFLSLLLNTLFFLLQSLEWLLFFPIFSISCTVCIFELHETPPTRFPFSSCPYLSPHVAILYILNPFFPLDGGMFL